MDRIKCLTEIDPLVAARAMRIRRNMITADEFDFAIRDCAVRVAFGDLVIVIDV